MALHARALSLALAVGVALSHGAANAQPRPVDPQSASPVADPRAEPVRPRSTPDLRGSLPATGASATVAAPSVSPAAARTRRPVQGSVRRSPRTPVSAPVLRPVYNARASSLPSAGDTDPPPPRPPRRRTVEDEFAPLGLRAGSFLLRPTFEAGVGGSDNVNASAAGRTPSAYARVAAGLRVDSDWTQHALNGRVRVERQDFRARGVDERVTVDAGLDLRLDLDRTRQVEGGIAFRRAPDTSTTFNLPVQAVGRPDQDTLTATAGVTQRLGRWQFRLRGQIDHIRYGETTFADGTRLSNGARDVDVRTVTLRAGYEVSPAVQPFIEASYNVRDFRSSLDGNGRPQGSTGQVIRAGVATDLGPKLRGEVSAGALVQRPEDPLAVTASGLAVDGTLAWSVSALTTLRGTVRTAVLDPSTNGIAGSTGGVSRDATLVLEHALRRNLLLTATVGYGIDDFSGVDRIDRRFTTGFGATWRFNRTLSWTVQATHQRLESSAPASDVRVSTIETVLRVEF